MIGKYDYAVSWLKESLQRYNEEEYKTVGLEPILQYYVFASYKQGVVVQNFLKVTLVGSVGEPYHTSAKTFFWLIGAVACRGCWCCRLPNRRRVMEPTPGWIRQISSIIHGFCMIRYATFAGRTVPACSLLVLLGTSFISESRIVTKHCLSASTGTKSYSKSTKVTLLTKIIWCELI